MPQGRAVYRENRVRDGITYEIIVYAISGGIYGTFKCANCDVTEVNATLSPNDGDALRAILSAVDAHHTAKHDSAH